MSESSTPTPVPHMKSSTVTATGGMGLSAELEGHRFALDADAEFGGHDAGPRPKGLVLTALAGCTAMDVIAILNKMKVPYEHLSVRAEGHLTDQHPKVFDRITLIYELRGDVPLDKVQRAVSLSQDKYCGVSAMLRASVKIGHEIHLNGERALVVEPAA